MANSSHFFALKSLSTVLKKQPLETDDNPNPFLSTQAPDAIYHLLQSPAKFLVKPALHVIAGLHTSTPTVLVLHYS